MARLLSKFQNGGFLCHPGKFKNNSRKGKLLLGIPNSVRVVIWNIVLADEYEKW